MTRGRLRLGVVLPACLLAACRGVLGIEPLELVGDGGVDGASSDGTPTGADADAAAPGSDASDGSTTADSPPDAPPDTSAIISMCVGQGTNCRPCCKMSLMQGNESLTMLAVQAGCICGSGQCASECDGSTCGGSGAPPPQACAMCTDTALLGPGSPSQPCSQAVDDCMQTPACAPVMQCLMACP